MVLFDNIFDTQDICPICLEYGNLIENGCKICKDNNKYIHSLINITNSIYSPTTLYLSPSSPPLYIFFIFFLLLIKVPNNNNELLQL